MINIEITIIMIIIIIIMIIIVIIIKLKPYQIFALGLSIERLKIENNSLKYGTWNN